MAKLAKIPLRPIAVGYVLGTLYKLAGLSSKDVCVAAVAEAGYDRMKWLNMITCQCRGKDPEAAWGVAVLRVVFPVRWLMRCKKRERWLCVNI